ncbi:MAG: ABC transporter permease [Geminicoccaceae bacterium]
MGSLSLASVRAVWIRQFLVWRKLIRSSLVTNVCNPLLFLFAFGFGLGAVMTEQEGVPYLAFVVPGMACYSALFVSSFETTISSYARYSMQRTWDATLATAVSLPELLLGEIVWAATKALLSAICLLVVGGLWGGVLSAPGAVLALAVLFLAALGFAAQGMLCTAYAKSFEAFSYFFTFWTTPMFVFSGVFFSLDRFPPAIATAAWLLPMPHVIALVRPLTTGTGLSLLPAVGHLLWLGVLFVVPYLLAVRRIRARMFD